MNQEAIMKIDPKMAIGSVTGPQMRPHNITGNGFEDLLKGMESTAASKVATTTAPIPMNSVSPQKINALSASDEALDLLERYSQSVVDPTLNLKSIAPMVDELDAMRVKVIQAGSFIADDDPLKGIMNEVSSALYGEVLRFHRGELIG
jgi:hypothetical protein